MKTNQDRGGVRTPAEYLLPKYENCTSLGDSQNSGGVRPLYQISNDADAQIAAGDVPSYRLQNLVEVVTHYDVQHWENSIILLKRQ